ncbi:MAG: FkbM family methyltransferase [Mesorhizobium sp.]|nr:MAG: FkbM family methyltransferase [Mesorhizobium sp.]
MEIGTSSGDTATMNRTFYAKLYHIDGLARAIGWRKLVSVLLRRALGIRSAMKVRCGDHELVIRPTDSDLFVMSQIFGHGEYEIGKGGQSALNRLAAGWRRRGIIPVIVDAGANVGYSSIFLRDQYPDAVVMAIEPDRQTHEVLLSNCAGLERIMSVYGALWCHEGEVALVNSERPSWARGVSDGEGVPSVTLRGLLSRLPKAKLLMLKMDIEGAELEATRDCGKVLKDVPCIIVEPHDFMFPGRGCLTFVYSLLSGRKIDSLVNGENLIFIASELLAAPAASRRPTTEGKRALPVRAAKAVP